MAFADLSTWHLGKYDNPSQQIPYLGEYITHSLTNLGSAGQPSIESLLAVQPDLILGTDFINADQYETLSDIAPTLVLQWDDAETNMRTIAQAVGYPEKADSLLTEIEQKIAAGKDKFSTFVAQYPNVLLLSSGQLQEIYMGNSAHGLCSSLLTDLGFNLVTLEGAEENRPGMPVPISLETLSQIKNADLIILLGSDLTRLDSAETFREKQLSGLKQAWERNAIVQSLNASKAGRVYFIPAYLCLGLPGPIGTELYLNELKQQLLPNQ
ncbi:ABC transporter substrate-binding protein [Leptolyngbya sp. 7M]|uniref:ABC transporter substrate-binding protein n=1 Tax=Leptolyngbya sp. 7M TaxID=2812896 RepID=UPI001B8D0E49|nr:ABC transporter substrate-binding protein [Leptolyngbya sp. 7M]QYO68703.1 ABC transporter substrate-binding protein [Leptolyngbya sp. 7M]